MECPKCLGFMILDTYPVIEWHCLNCGARYSRMSEWNRNNPEIIFAKNRPRLGHYDKKLA